MLISVSCDLKPASNDPIIQDFPYLETGKEVKVNNLDNYNIDDQYFSRQVYKNRSTGKLFTGTLEMTDIRGVKLYEVHILKGRLQWKIRFRVQGKYEQYYNEQKKITGIKSRMWHKSGELKAIRYNDNTYESYSKDGTLLATGNDTLITTYWKNGEVKAYYPAKNGVRNNAEGMVKEFYENGQLKLKGYYKNGKLDGKWVEYDSLGNVIAEERYVMGSKQG